MQTIPRVPAEFWDRVDMSGDCWMWTGPVTHAGYGRFYTNYSSVRAHRFAYEQVVGTARDGLDHLCHNADPGCPGGPACRHRRCVNPRHLEDVPTLINVRRAVARRVGSTTQCKRGHTWSAENTYREPATGRRKCRACWRVTAHARYHGRKVA